MKVTAAVALLTIAVQARLETWDRKDIERRTKCGSGSCIVINCPKKNIDRFTAGKQIEGAALRWKGYNIGCDKSFMISADENVCWKFNDGNLDRCAKGSAPTPYGAANAKKYAAKEKMEAVECAKAAAAENKLCLEGATAKALERSKQSGRTGSGASALVMGATLALSTAILY